MITSYSKFYYGIEVTEFTRFFSFSEGGPEKVASLKPGKYALTGFVNEVARAMNAVGSLVYTTTVNRSTRLITISAPSNFTLPVATGSSLGAYPVIGFTGLDKTGASSYTGTLAIGKEYSPQFRLQSYVDFEDNQKTVESQVLESATGQVEVVKFGTYKIMECDIDFITNIDQGIGAYIRTNLNGLANARDFMVYATTKGKLEFIPDETNVSVFRTCILESTPESQKGVDFKLKEKFSQGLIGYYSTGLLTFREVST